MSQTEQTTELAVPSPQSTALATSPILRPVVRVDEMVQHHKDMAAFVQGALELGRDFGAIPGTGDKPTLLKPGAERLLIGFGCASEFEIVEQEADHAHPNTFINKKWEAVDTPKLANGRQDDDAVKVMKAAGTHRFRKTDNGWQFQQAEIEAGESLGLYRYVIRAIIRHRATGEVVGHGIGSCSSLESKYIRSPRDAENTILKMAKKRALVDAVLTTFGLSDRFTQDVEEIAENQKARSGKAEQEEPTSKPQTEGQKMTVVQVSAWVKSIGMKKAAFDAFKALCESRSVFWPQICREAFDVGVKTADQLTAYFESGELPDDGQGELDSTGQQTKATKTTAETTDSETTPEVIDAEFKEETYTGPTVKPEADPYADDVEQKELAEAK